MLLRPKSYGYNSYFESYYGRTYKPLTTYYLPAIGYKTQFGYYSPEYLTTYYDGYGYNFYTGQGNYYQFSKPEIPRSNATPVLATITVIIFFCFCVNIIFLRFKI